MTRLSCLMAVYNDEKSLAQSIESVLKQSYLDFHFLIFNDGSEDRSLSILKEYEKKDARIQVFSEKQPFGIPYAYNQLLKKTKTKYFVFQGASDFSAPDRFETLLKTIEKTSLVALGSRVIWDKEPIGGQKEIRNVSEYAKEVLKRLFTEPKKPSFYLLSGIYSKKIIEKKIEFDETIPAYYDLLFIGLIQNHFPLRMSNLAKVLYAYRILPGSLPHLLEEKKIRVDFEQIENFFLAKLAAPYSQFVIDPQIFQAIVPF